MGRRDDSKIRIIAVLRIVREDRFITAREVQEHLLRTYDICADRKTIYADFKAINRIVPIETMAGRRGGFRILNVLARCDDDC